LRHTNDILGQAIEDEFLLQLDGAGKGSPPYSGNTDTATLTPAFPATRAEPNSDAAAILIFIVTRDLSATTVMLTLSGNRGPRTSTDNFCWSGAWAMSNSKLTKALGHC
jgi:hypothetical protein